VKKWMPLKGEFVEDDGKIVFQGTINSSVFDQTPNPSIFQMMPDGIILFEDMISNGSIEANVAFEDFEKGALAQIIFNYQNDNCFMCAGIANAMQKYGFNVINGQQSRTIYATGLINELPGTEFYIKLKLSGSFLALYINDIQVFTCAIPFGMYHTQVGMWVKSNGKVTIRDFKTSYKRPEAFIVSQFGDYYDVLYDEVIKPVCEELHYAPIRGDEVASCTLILNDIITSIHNSAVIIADITPDNPNVFYEVGYAHALAKPTILLCEKSVRSKLPFDVSGFRTIFYDNSIGGKGQVEDKLKAHLRKISCSCVM